MLTTTFDMDVESLNIQCIICYEECSNSQSFQKGSDIFYSPCSCDYMVHSDCIQEWIDKQPQNETMCICCNTPANLKPTTEEPIDHNNKSLICCNILLLTLMTMLTISFIYLN